MEVTKENIKFWLDNGFKETSIDFSKGWGAIQEVLLSFGYKELEGDDFMDATNGWDVSFWYTWEHELLPDLTVTGSLHSGNFKLVKD